MGITEATLQLLITMKDEATSGLSSITSALGGLGTIAGGAALAGVAALGGAIASGVADAREAAQVMAQTQAVIQSTGGAAGVTADQISAMAGQLSAASGKSLFGDDDIQRGQNMLLTFTNIKDTLPDTTQVMVDMAQALGTDMAGQAMQLGKALNDPIQGISALTRVGVTFTDQQKEQIKTMQDAGDMAGAQQVILAELNKEFGGSALAAAQADGGVAQFWDRIGEAKETLGAAVLPLLGQFVGLLNDYVLPLVETGAQLFSDLVGSLQSTGGVSGAISDNLSGLSHVFGDVWAAAQEVFNTLMVEGKPILDDLGKIAIPALVAAGQILAALWTNVLSPSLQALWYLFKTYLLPAIGEVVHILAIVLPPAIQLIASLFTDILFPAINKIIQALDWVGQKIEDVIGWFQQLGDGLANIQIPEWLQGHSPPPLADWFSAIGDAATGAQDAAGGMGFGAPGGALPAIGGGGAVTISVGQIVVQGATDAEATALAVRQKLLELGQRNLNIFGGYA